MTLSLEKALFDLPPEQKEVDEDVAHDRNFPPMPPPPALKEGEKTLRQLQNSLNEYYSHANIRENRARTRQECDQYTRRSTVLGRRALTVAAAVAIIPGHQAVGIANTYEQWSGNNSSIIEIAEALDPENADVLITGAVGFGGGDATNMMEALRPLDQYGNLIADKESTNGIDTDEQAEQLVEYATENKIRRIIAIGHSIGGLKQLNKIARAKEIVKEKGLDIEMNEVVLLQTPYSIDSVKSGMRTFGMEVCNYAQAAPWGKYYWPFRFIPEFLSRKAQYGKNPIEMTRVAMDVYDTKIENPTATTNVLYDQFCVQLGATARGAMSKLSGINITHIHPEDGHTDTVVDRYDAVPRFAQEAKRNGISFYSHEMENVGHSSPGQEPEVFNRALNETVLPRVAAEKRRDKFIQECIRQVFYTGALTIDDCHNLASPEHR